MTMGQVRAELARWSFMPGWTFHLQERTPGAGDFGPDFVVLEIRSTVPDAYPPHDPVEVISTAPMPLMRYWEPERFAEFFGQWLRRVVRQCMEHEVDEWLKRDGVAPFDPHVPKKG